MSLEMDKFVEQASHGIEMMPKSTKPEQYALTDLLYRIQYELPGDDIDGMRHIIKQRLAHYLIIL